MVQVIWAAPAADDLRAIHDYIANDSARYARIMVTRLQDAARFLAESPEMGQVVTELPESGYREHVVGKYRLIYRYESHNARIVIMGVIHGSRELRRAMQDRM
jgi:plasmid stabilization system protein ParE